MLLWHYYDLFIKSTLWLVSGTQHGLGQWVGVYPKNDTTRPRVSQAESSLMYEQRRGCVDKMSPVFFNKSNKAMRIH